MRFSLFILFGIFLSNSLSAQLNLKVGYQYSATDPTVNNKIIDQINSNNSSFEDYNEMESIKSFNGINFGTRYRAGYVGLNLDWTPKFQKVEFDGFNPATNSNEFRELFYRYNTYSLGLEFFIKKFSFGASYDWNRMRIQSENTARTDRHIIFKSNSTSSHFYISYNVYGNEYLTIGIQPYVQIPWTKFDLTNLENDLNTGVNLDSYEDEFMTYGFRIVLQNGYYEKE
jgi:hypothetical protein